MLLALFVVTLVGQSVAGHRQHNEEQRDHAQPTLSYTGYLASPSLLEATMENWESEFLSLAGMVLLTIWLRQHGSPESKPVDAPHAQTGAE